MDCFASLAMTISLTKVAPFKLITIRNKSLLRVSGDCVFDIGFNVAHCPATPPIMGTSHTVKSSVAAISIFASASMAAAKFVVGIAIGSLALISEALHSSVDVVATVITWMVVQVSGRPADEEHHYGHGKIESLSALGVIAMLYVLAGGILGAAWGRLREGAPPPVLSVIPFAVLLLDIAVNLWRAWALHRTARATSSQALAADALHFASDVLGAIAVIGGLALSGLGYRWGD